MSTFSTFRVNPIVIKPFRPKYDVFKHYAPSSEPEAGMDEEHEKPTGTGNDHEEEPEISTLREETSPAPAPPPPSALSRFRVKLKVKPPSEKSTVSTDPKPSKHGSGDEGGSESENEQWDQLEDDEPPSVRNTPAKSIPAPTPPSTSGRGRGRGGGRGRGRGRGAAALAPTHGEPPQTVFEVMPSGATPQAEQGTPGILDTVSMSGFSTPSGKPPKKRAKKGEGEPRRVGRKPR